MKKYFQKYYGWIILVVIVAGFAIGAVFYIYKKNYQNISQPNNANQNNNLPANTDKTSLKKTPITVNSSNRPIWGKINQEVNIGNTNNKQIALTFDCGSGIQSARQILDTLKANNLKATFFITGKFAEQNPEIVKEILNNGNTIGNHTYSHPYLTQISDTEIAGEFSKTENIIKGIAPSAVLKPYFRPPYGDRNQHVLDYVGSLGYQSIYWTVDAWDWKEGISADIVTSRIFLNEKNGAIILMHVGDDITGAVLQNIINKLQSDGYKLGPLEEVLK